MDVFNSLRCCLIVAMSLILFEMIESGAFFAVSKLVLIFFKLSLKFLASRNSLYKICVYYITLMLRTF